MIRLAQFSPDPGIRAVAVRWLQLPRRIRRKAMLESLCASAAVPYHEFFAEIVVTAAELGIDATGMLRAHRNATIMLQALARQAIRPRGARARRRFLEAAWGLSPAQRRRKAPFADRGGPRWP
jgi:hypothetical protein